MYADICNFPRENIFLPYESQNEYFDRKEKGLGFIKNFVESEKELKSIREDVRREKFH